MPLAYTFKRSEGRNSHHAHHGFSLTEMVVVLLLVTIVLGISLSAGRTQLRIANHKATQQSLERVSRALDLFHEKNGRYPCPANPAAIEGSADFGLEKAGCFAACDATLTCPASGNAAIGTIPFAPLGLTEDDITDSWDTKLTYIVDRLHTNRDEPAIYGTIPVFDKNGVEITRMDHAGDAIYLLVSHGSNENGGWGVADTTQSACDAALLESENCDNDDVFIDTRINESNIEANFSDDLVFWKVQENVDHLRKEKPKLSGNTNRDAPHGTVYAGDGHTCYLSPSRELWCWGSNVNGELGNGSFATQATPALISSPGSGNMYRIAAFDTTQSGTAGIHSCAVDTTGQQWCWGSRDSGRIGDGGATTGDVNAPVALLNDDVRYVTTDGDTSLAINNRFDLYGWGSNSNDMYADSMHSALASSNIPMRIMVGVSQISAGREIFCALRIDATVACWGTLYPGADGDPQTIQQVPGLSNVVKVDSGKRHTCAITALPGNNLHCWGINSHNVLGADDATVGGSFLDANLTPYNVPLSNIRDVSLGRHHSCAIDASGAVWCWGRNDEFQTGNPVSTDISITNVPIIDDAVSIAAGANHSCVVRADENVWCWGNNSTSQYGTPALSGATPQQLVGAPWQ